MPTLPADVQERFAQIIRLHHHEDDVQEIGGCRRLVDRMAADYEGRDYVAVVRNPDGTIAPVAAATPGVSISGTVRNTNGSPLSGVSFNGLPSQSPAPVSDAAGNYRFVVPSGFTGSVTPSLSGRSFSPSTRTYGAITSDQTAQAYTS